MIFEADTSDGHWFDRARVALTWPAWSTACPGKHRTLGAALWAGRCKRALDGRFFYQL
jgi:hypothetical protein